MEFSNQPQVRPELDQLRTYLLVGVSSLILAAFLFLIFNVGSSPESQAATNAGNIQVNAYAKVTAISGNTLTLSNVDESNDTFAANTEIILIQMQDNVIGSNILNTITFGTVSGISNAGKFERLTINSVSRTSGNLTSVTISGAILNSYSTGSNASLQIVSFPKLGNSSGYTTTSDIKAEDWDGDIGGVVAFQVDGTLTLNNDIKANGAGFRGAATNTGGTGGCVGNMYISSSTASHSEKGEGVQKVTNSGWVSGIAALVNGGGGGSSHNGGGAGGSNFTAGGNGGPGWSCSVGGGMGGVSLLSYIDADRVFMGGGGGAGEVNNGYNSAGGNGGGIIMIHADILRTTGSGNVEIKANGEDGNSVGNDGAGAGGAGGSILLEIDSFDVSSSAQLRVKANGGDGGDVNSSASHGAGGGGGQGVIFFSKSSLPNNVDAQTENGSGGANNSSGSSYAGNGQGSDDQGIYYGQSMSLPVELLSFEAMKEGEYNLIKWSTASEVNNDYFILESSSDGLEFNEIEKIQGNGNSNDILEYNTKDFRPYAVTYYRLTQYDYDNTHEMLGVRVVDRSKGDDVALKVYPNPVVDGTLFIDIPEDNRFESTLELLDATGKVVEIRQISNFDPQEQKFDLQGLPAGIYFVKFQNERVQKTERVLVQ